MLYAHRWIYILFITVSILLADYFYDVRPHRQILFDQKIKAAVLIQSLLASSSDKLKNNFAKNNLSRQTSLNWQWKGLSFLTSSAALHSVTIQKIAFKTPEQSLSINTAGVFLQAEGSFQQIQSFIFSLLDAQALYWIDHFLLRLDKKNKLVMEMDVILLPLERTIKNSPAAANQQASPFCLSWGRLPENGLTLTAFPLTQISMRGYFKKGDQYEALVSMPDGSVSMVTVGEKLGREQAMVTHVQADYMTVSLSHHDKKIIKM